MTLRAAVICGGAVASNSVWFALALERYGFYAEGAEASAAALAAESTPLTQVVDVDANIQLRIGLQEVGRGSVGGAATDDYQLRFSIDGAAYGNLTTISTGVRVNTGSALVSGAATTQRLSSGSGSFVAGEQDDNDGLITDHQLTANNFTEHLWALTLVAADLLDGNVVTFDLLWNGSPITSTVMPTLTVSKNVDPAGPPENVTTISGEQVTTISGQNVQTVGGT